MSNRYRRSYLAAGRWLVVAILLATPALGQTDEPKGSGVEGEAATQESEAQTPAAAPTKKKRKSARYYEALCKSATDPKDRDLCQQWRMAEAAKKQAKWTQRQFWATVAEIGALALTVLFTGWAAIAAGRAAKAANKSVALTEDTAKRELRAYFLYDLAEILDFGPGLRPSIRLIFKNYGQTPASEVVMWVAFDLLPYPLVAPLQKQAINSLWSRAIVGPQCTTRVVLALGRALTAGEVGNIIGRQVALYAWGESLYKDTFGTDQRTEFCLIYGGSDGPHPEGLFSSYHEGNKAT